MHYFPDAFSHPGQVTTSGHVNLLWRGGAGHWFAPGSEAAQLASCPKLGTASVSNSWSFPPQGSPQAWGLSALEGSSPFLWAIGSGDTSSKGGTRKLQASCLPFGPAWSSWKCSAVGPQVAGCAVLSPVPCLSYLALVSLLVSPASAGAPCI